MSQITNGGVQLCRHSRNVVLAVCMGSICLGVFPGAHKVCTIFCIDGTGETALWP